MAYLFYGPLEAGSTWSLGEADAVFRGGEAKDQLGVAIAARGDLALLGANGEDTFAGAAYLFDLTP